MGQIRRVPRGEDPPRSAVWAPDWAWIPIVVVLVAVLALVVPLFTGERLTTGTFLALFLPILPVVAVVWLLRRMRHPGSGVRS